MVRIWSRPVPAVAVVITVLLAASVTAAVVGTGETTDTTVTANGGAAADRPLADAADSGAFSASPSEGLRAADAFAPTVTDSATARPSSSRAGASQASVPPARNGPTSSIPGPTPGGARTSPTAPPTTDAPSAPPTVCRARAGGAARPQSPFTTREPGLYVIRPDGGGARRILRSRTDRNFYWVAWSPDGRTIAASDDRDLWVVTVDGGSPREVAEELFTLQFPAWSPDGRSLAFVGREGAAEATPHLYVAAADGSGRRRVANAPDAPSLVTWSPDGSRIAVVTYGGAVWSLRPDGTDLRKHVAGSTPYAISWRGGDHLVVAGDADGATGVHLVGLDGSRRQLLGRSGEVATSPDCRRVAVTDSRLTVVDAETGAATELASGESDGTHFASPGWAPDNGGVLVTASRTYAGSGRYETDQDVLIVGLDGVVHELVDQDPTWGWVASARGWSPDGSLVAFGIAGY